MKIAIISLTNQGQKLAIHLSKLLIQDPTIFELDLFHKNVKQTLKDIFHHYDCIIGIMASGIMIRSICPLIHNKIEDPAVLVMDEASKHIISLVSGHLGGANEWALKIADIVASDSVMGGLNPVITTATDVRGKIGIDSLARKYQMLLDDPSKIIIINQALLEGNEVELAVPQQFDYLFKDKLIKSSYSKISSPSGQIMASFKNTNIILIPGRLVVGIGARIGVSKGDVMSAVNETLSILKIPPERVDAMATAEPKREERGILEAAAEMSVPLEIISLNLLRKFKHPECSESSWVMKTFGAQGVCEPSALLAAGDNSHLIFCKKIYNKVTVAVAVSFNH